jgi:hypothetical protein
MGGHSAVRRGAEADPGTSLLDPGTACGRGLLGTISLLILLGTLGSSCTGERGETLEEVARERAADQLTIDPEHRECESDADCIVVPSRCSAGEYGEPVNRRLRNHYEEKHRELCDDYSGAVCEFHCETPHSRCIEESCRLSR